MKMIIVIKLEHGVDEVDRSCNQLQQQSNLGGGGCDGGKV
jgi:hypothetical protein